MANLRTISPAGVALINANRVSLTLLLRLDYTPAILLNSSGQSVDWGGDTYLGAGKLGTVDAVRDTTGEISGLKFALSGVRPEDIGLVLTESARGKRARLWLGLADADNRQIAEALLLFDGMLDQLPISMQPPSAQIGATAVHMGALLQRPHAFIYSDADQQRAAPGDTSGRFLVSQSQHQDIWPAASFFRQ